MLWYNKYKIKEGFRGDFMRKTALVTGGSGAIGAACCERLYNAGYNIVTGYLSNEKSASELVRKFGDDRCIAVKADISDAKQTVLLTDTAVKKFGGIDVVVNNAALSMSGLFQDMNESELARIIDVNIKGAFYVSQNAVKYMLKNKSGSIINISSMWGETGASTEVAYSMTKSAIIGFTKALAKEVGPSGIRVNCVSPGLIDTPMNSCYTPQDLAAISDETPLSRIGQPTDVADAVEFLASEKSSFITGQIIGVNGGFVI